MAVAHDIDGSLRPRLDESLTARVRLAPLEAAAAGLALQSATARCMAERGFEYVPLPVIPPLDSAQRNAPSTRAEALQYGFQPPPRVFGSFSVAEADLQQRLGADPVYAEALGGTAEDPSTGCSAEALASVRGSEELSELMSWAQRTDASARDRARSSDEYVAALANWSACMKDRGFDLESEVAMRELDWPSPRPGVQEREMAVANVECREASGTLTILDAAVAESARQYLDENPSTLDEIAATRATLLASVEPFLGMVDLSTPVATLAPPTESVP